MIGYNNQSIRSKLLPYNSPTPIPLKSPTQKSWGRPRTARLLPAYIAARAIFGAPGIFKWEGLITTDTNCHNINHLYDGYKLFRCGRNTIDPLFQHQPTSRNPSLSLQQKYFGCSSTFSIDWCGLCANSDALQLVRLGTQVDENCSQQQQQPHHPSAKESIAVNFVLLFIARNRLMCARVCVCVAHKL